MILKHIFFQFFTDQAEREQGHGGGGGVAEAGEKEEEKG